MGLMGRSLWGHVWNEVDDLVSGATNCSIIVQATNLEIWATAADVINQCVNDESLELSSGGVAFYAGEF